jgi:single-stranded-DNA-specific exonuclease
MGTYTCNLGGESYRQDTIRRCHEGERVILKREPDNPHDKNAIAVLREDGDQIAYLSRDNAEWVAPLMDEGQELEAKIKWITGGTRDKPTRGVLIELNTTPRSQTRQTEKTSEKGLLQRLLGRRQRD